MLGIEAKEPRRAARLSCQVWRWLLMGRALMILVTYEWKLEKPGEWGFCKIYWSLCPLVENWP